MQRKPGETPASAAVSTADATRNSCTPLLQKLRQPHRGLTQTLAKPHHLITRHLHPGSNQSCATATCPNTHLSQDSTESDRACTNNSASPKLDPTRILHTLSAHSCGHAGQKIWPLPLLDPSLPQGCVRQQRCCWPTRRIVVYRVQAHACRNFGSSPSLNAAPPPPIPLLEMPTRRSFRAPGAWGHVGRVMFCGCC